MFITFEGVDGSGKSTQAKLLFDYIKTIVGENNVILTREPGGTILSEKIRELIFSTENINPISELLLFISARKEHLEKIILPAIQNNKIVICDRYIDSTIAYQGYGFNLNIDLIEKLHDILNIRKPDLTFLLNIDINISLSRAISKKKFECMGIEIYEKIQNGFLKIAQENPEKYHIIQSNNNIQSNDIDDIHEKILSITSKYLNKKNINI